MNKNILKLYGNDYHNRLNVLRLLVFITDKCNYDCSYCYNAKPRQNIDIDCEKLLHFISDIHKKTDKLVRVELIGGEVTLHSSFDRLCRKLNELEYVIDIEIYTNLHKNIDYYNQLISGTKIEVNATWHSIKNDPFNAAFTSKILSLSDDMFKHYYITVMFEPSFMLQSLRTYNALLEKHPNARNIEPSLCIQQVDGRPYSYNEHDLKQFYEICNASRANRSEFYIEYTDHTVDKLTFNELQGLSINSFKFWKCNVGIDFLYINNNGSVYRCAHDALKHRTICNISDEEYLLPTKPTVCPYEYCPCNWEIYREKIFKHDA